MTGNQNDDKPAHGARTISRQLLYSLVAGFAAIAGFLTVVVVDRLSGQGAVQTLQFTEAKAADSVSEGPSSSGLEKLVRSDHPKPLPDISFTDGEGQQHSLDEWKGRVVLVNLWATWCAPCRVEMPSLNRLQAKLGGPDFSVVAISLDWGGPDKPRQYLKSNKLDHLDLYLDSSKSLMQTLEVPGLPLSVLVDRQGRELARLAGAAEWDLPEVEALIRAAIDAEEQG